jgi:23S rRNA maturation mini-RNase III
MKDRFEPEYKISKDNLAMLAFAGDGTFSGYIRKECLESSRVK